MLATLARDSLGGYRWAVGTVDQATARRRNAEGLAALNAGDLSAAIAALAEATTADPTAGALWRNLAHAHRLDTNDSGERAALEQALAIDRLDFVANLRLAQLLMRRNEEAAALKAWTGVLQLADGMGDPPPALAEELADGQAYLKQLKDKLTSAGDRALAHISEDFDETEQRRVNAFVDYALGRRPVYTNQCDGVFYPFLPADEFFDRRHFPWFDRLEAAAPAIRSELAGLLASGDDALRPYVRLDEGTPEGIWSPLDGSLDWGVAFLWEYGVPNAPIIERCPATAKLLGSLPLARIPGRAPNAFFSLLRPGRKIPPHTGVTNTRAIVHLGLDIPAGCGFRVGGETREWREGKAFAFDDTIEHEAWNTSDTVRAVLILDCWNPHLSPRECAAISAYFEAADSALA